MTTFSLKIELGNDAMQTDEDIAGALAGLGIYQVVYPEPGKVSPKLKTDLNKFLNQWLSNLIEQGFKVIPAGNGIQNIQNI